MGTGGGSLWCSRWGMVGSVTSMATSASPRWWCPEMSVGGDLEFLEKAIDDDACERCSTSLEASIWELLSSAGLPWAGSRRRGVASTLALSHAWAWVLQGGRVGGRREATTLDLASGWRLRWLFLQPFFHGPGSHHVAGL
ncbi:hypothetical protein U9M48_006104 [Paspalum notatum var. saurae]|uniref:Uncharacterized protein n=1 Tax=Paspalum notatum var. saurae TaxID=547442 RepID=A0AAQ3PZ24_PASNO